MTPIQWGTLMFGVLLLRNFIGETVGVSTAVSGGNPLQSGLKAQVEATDNTLDPFEIQF